MPSSLALVVLGVAAVLAVVSLIAAIVAVRAVRSLRQEHAEVSAPARAVAEPPTPQPAGHLVVRAPAPAHLVEGRVIVPPTQEQVVAAQMTRPQVRIAILVAGLMHALRPESRDRIAGLMRRELRERRRARQRAARRAARTTPTPPAQTDGWLSS